MTLLVRTFLLFWFAALHTSMGFAEIQTSPLPKEKQSIRITADHMVQEGDKDTVKAWGNVVIRFEDRVLRADKVRVHNKTGIGEAMGHVLLTSKDGTLIKASRSRFNMKSKRTKAFDVVGKFKGEDDKKLPFDYYFKGKEIKKVAKDHYRLKDSFITTCTGKVPDWSFEAGNLDVIKDDRALFSHGVFKVKDIPILYFPLGYIPLNKKRKSGFLIPEFGVSNTDGITFKPIYYWVIDDHSDATIGVEYLEKRGVRPEFEYRYTPSQKTKGEFKGVILDDRSTDELFYKVDWTHDQVFKNRARFKAKLDLESEGNFNKTFEDNTSLRTRRNTDSFASLNKNWTNSTLDILTRFRDSTQDGNDDTFGQLPQITYQHQRQPIGKSSFQFNQETSYTNFLLDLNPAPTVDDTFQVHRFDFHPQISRPISIAPWLAFTPTLGLRETVYSKGLVSGTTTRTSSFTRESIDINGALEGPKINKIYFAGRKRKTKIKHVIEPRVSYDYIPDIDRDDRNKIRVIDEVDAVTQTSLVTYSLTQRLLKKILGKNGNTETREILRLDVSQSYDFDKDTQQPISAINNGKALSNLRFDLNSRLADALLFNIDATYDVYDKELETLNFEVGVKPVPRLSLFVERRFILNESRFALGSLYWALDKGWQIQASTRYDELEDNFLENDFSLLYNNPCKCWGFSFDFINRNIISGGVDRQENKFLFTLTLLGVGTEGIGDNNLNHIHRRF